MAGARHGIGQRPAIGGTVEEAEVRIACFLVLFPFWMTRCIPQVPSFCPSAWLILPHFATQPMTDSELRTSWLGAKVRPLSTRLEREGNP
jgi:hypothetical protein